jgi:hypothetical protein
VILDYIISAIGQKGAFRQSTTPRPGQRDQGNTVRRLPRSYERDHAARGVRHLLDAIASMAAWKWGAVGTGLVPLRFDGSTVERSDSRFTGERLGTSPLAGGGANSCYANDGPNPSHESFKDRRDFVFLWGPFREWYEFNAGVADWQFMQFSIRD